MALVDILTALPGVFTPTQPIALPDLLSGRLELLFRLQDDILTPGNHALLYGDRGVGKTSIARVLGVLMQQGDQSEGRRSILVSCDTQDTFGTIWRKVLQEILLAQRAIGFAQEERLQVTGRLDPHATIESPNDLRLIVDGLPNSIVVIIDEFDRVHDDGTRLLMTDTIKLFSDNRTRCSIVLVGVGQSIEELVRAHQSISRNLDFVHVEPMTHEELVGIVRRGFPAAGLNYEVGTDHRIAELSQGYPHYTHLLGLWSGRMAAERDSNSVTSQDLSRAISASIRNAAGSIRLEYETATDSTRPNNLFKEVLLACAMADKDVRGRFTLTAVRGPLQQILGRPISPVSYQRHLATFCEEDHGPTLIRTGSRRNYHWYFANPQLVPFVYLQGINDGLVSSELAP